MPVGRYVPMNISGTLSAGRCSRRCWLLKEYPVSAESLVTELWGNRPRHGWRTRCRRTSAGCAAGSTPLPTTGRRLVVQHSGYHLQTDEDAVDAKVFMREFANARFLGATDPTSAADRLRGALSLWRGKAFSLVTQRLMCRTVAQRYEPPGWSRWRRCSIWNCGASGTRTSSRCCRSWWKNRR